MSFYKKAIFNFLSLAYLVDTADYSKIIWLANYHIYDNWNTPLEQ